MFRLFSKTEKQTDNVYLKCLVERCSNQILELFPLLNILPQSKPAAQSNETNEMQMGFPFAKKNLINDIIKLYYYLSNTEETIKYLLMF